MQSLEKLNSELTVLSSRNRRILIIDDNPAIHKDFRKSLAPRTSLVDLEDAESAFFGEPRESREDDFNCEIDSAHQGEEGLKKVVEAIQANVPYALAFVDMRMPPGWDGLTTIEHLWQVAPDLQIVICSAYSDHSWADICKRLGSSDRLLILKKPFDSSEVCQLAVSLTEKWNLAIHAKLKRDDLARLVDEQTAELKQKDIELRQKHKLEAIGSLAGGVAHEFNNLLQAIRGYACFARDALPVDGQPYEDLGHVVDASDRASGIVSQLLSFSRRTPAQKEMRPANDIVTTTLAMFKPLRPGSIEIEVTLGDESITVFADTDLISQALLNLCINARDAMPTGGRLQVSLQQQSVRDRRDREISVYEPLLVPGEYAVISVSDNGCGIADDVKDRIFEPFYTTKEVGKGTGMGLAIVYGALREHGGMVTVESVIGIGSTFRIFLPVKTQNARIEVSTSVSDVERSAHGHETVLFAEDDVLVRDVSVRLLRQAGYSVIEAIDGQDAIDKFQKHANSIHLVIMDVVMPKLSGYEAAIRIQSIRPEAKIVFCSGYDPEATGPSLLKNSVSDVVCKPMRSDKLLALVRDQLNEVSLCQS